MTHPNPRPDKNSIVQQMVTTLCDASPSMAHRGKQESAAREMRQYEQSLCDKPGTVLQRWIFNSAETLLDVDEDGRSPKFFNPNTLVGDRAFGGRRAPYQLTGGTHLSRIYARHLQRLIERFSRDKDRAYTHVLITITDGLNQGPDRTDIIRNRWMQDFNRLVEQQRCGYERSRLVSWYIGIGETEEKHREQAFERMYLPFGGWFKWVESSAEGVRVAGNAMRYSSDSLSRDEGTILHFDPNDRMGHPDIDPRTGSGSDQGTDLGLVGSRT